MRKLNQLQCKDCYFSQAGLCALQLDSPCPTFRYGARGAMTAPRQAQLVPRELAAGTPARFLATHQAA
ncbi:MAG TPA: hypothetical protein VLJ76_09415 [Gaiellaceae bacterium]|nr:hypothetical protein [Gaiellaceae bacterium]